MSMYLDSPEDAIQDEFDTVVFPNHQLGVNILGTVESVKAFTREDFQEFIDENLDTEKIVVSVVGNLDFKKVVSVAQKFLNDIFIHTYQSKKVYINGLCVYQRGI